ncbi:YncE family protein [Mycobacterium sp. NPDC003323]
MASVFVRANAAALNDSQTAFAGSVAVDRGPIGAVAANADTIVVANYGDDSLTVVRPHTVAGPSTVVIDGEPFAVTLTDDRAFVATSAAEADALVVVDIRTNSVIGSYPLAFGVTALAASPDGKRGYVARAGHDHADIAVVDTTADRVGTIDIATGAATSIDGLAVDPAGRRLYVGVTTPVGSRVMVVDTETTQVRRSIAIGAPIRDLAVAADGTVYVLSSGLDSRGVMTVIDPATLAVTGAFAAGTLPIQMAISADGARAYIVDYDQVSVLCTLTREIVETITVGTRPTAAALSTAGDRLYVADIDGQITALRVPAPTPMYSPFDAAAFGDVRELAQV